MIDRDAAKPEKEEDKEEKKDAILFTGRHEVHHVYDHDVDTSDSEDDWEDY